MQEGMRQAMVRLGEQYRHLDRVALNQANASTPGYRSGDGGVRQGDFASWLRLSEGSHSETGRDLDVSLPADSYLSVKTPAGVRYTRRGDLRLDDTRQLVTGAGEPVLGEDGQPIVAPKGNVTILRNGKVLDAGQPVGTLGRYQVDGFRSLAGADLEALDPATVRADSREITTGSLEGSNVDAVREQTELIHLTNRAKLFGELIQIQDQTLDKAFRDLGRGH